MYRYRTVKHRCSLQPRQVCLTNIIANCEVVLKDFCVDVPEEKCEEADVEVVCNEPVPGYEVVIVVLILVVVVVAAAAVAAAAAVVAVEVLPHEPIAHK